MDVDLPPGSDLGGGDNESTERVERNALPAKSGRIEQSALQEGTRGEAHLLVNRFCSLPSRPASDFGSTWHANRPNKFQFWVTLRDVFGQTPHASSHATEDSMKLLAKKVHRFLVSEDGPTAVEYAVMLALIVIVCLTAISSIGTNANTTFTDVANSIAAS